MVERKILVLELMPLFFLELVQLLILIKLQRILNSLVLVRAKYHPQLKPLMKINLSLIVILTLNHTIQPLIGTTFCSRSTIEKQLYLYTLMLMLRVLIPLLMVARVFLTLPQYLEYTLPTEALVLYRFLLELRVKRIQKPTLDQELYVFLET
jgi:hypothetical protein